MEERQLTEHLYNEFIHSFKFAVRTLLVSKRPEKAGPAAQKPPCCYIESVEGTNKKVAVRRENGRTTGPGSQLTLRSNSPRHREKLAEQVSTG